MGTSDSKVYSISRQERLRRIIQEKYVASNNIDYEEERRKKSEERRAKKEEQVQRMHAKNFKVCRDVLSEERPKLASMQNSQFQQPSPSHPTTPVPMPRTRPPDDPITDSDVTSCHGSLENPVDLQEDDPSCISTYAELFPTHACSLPDSNKHSGISNSFDEKVLRVLDKKIGLHCPPSNTATIQYHRSNRTPGTQAWEDISEDKENAEHEDNHKRPSAPGDEKRHHSSSLPKYSPVLKQRKIFHSLLEGIFGTSDPVLPISPAHTDIPARIQAENTLSAHSPLPDPTQAEIITRLTLVVTTVIGSIERRFSKTGCIQKDDAASQELCDSLEAVFLHKLKDAKMRSFCQLICRLTPSSLRETMTIAERSKEDIALIRIWIRVLLNHNLLADTWSAVISKKTSIRRTYQEGAYFQDVSNYRMLLMYADLLNKVKFELNSSFLRNEWTKRTRILCGNIPESFVEENIATPTPDDVSSSSLSDACRCLCCIAVYVHPEKQRTKQMI